MFEMTKEKLWVATPVIASIAMADQFTKSMIEKTMFLNQSLEIIPGFFNIVYVKNPGAAWGLFSDMASLRVPFLVSVSVIAVGVIFYLIGDSKGQAPVIALSMICGGAIGNLIDRATLGEVTDFLDFYIGNYHWPAFNVADSAITVGVALMIVFFYLEEKNERAKAKSDALSQSKDDGEA